MCSMATYGLEELEGEMKNDFQEKEKKDLRKKTHPQIHEKIKKKKLTTQEWNKSKQEKNI